MKCNLTFEYFEFLQKIVQWQATVPKLLFRTLAKCAKTFFTKIKLKLPKPQIFKRVEEVDPILPDEKFSTYHAKFFEFLELLLVESDNMIVKEFEI